MVLSRENDVHLVFPSERNSYRYHNKMHLHGLKTRISGNEWLDRLYFILVCSLFSLGLVRQEKIDVIAGWNFIPNLICLMISKATGKEFIADMTDFGFDLMRSGGVLPSPVVNIIRYFECSVIPKSCSKLIVVSEYMKRKIMEFSNIPESKVYCVNDGVDFQNFKKVNRKLVQEIAHRYDIHRNDKIVLYIGDVEYYDGVDILIDAIKKLKKENVKLLVVGNGRKYYDTLRAENLKDANVLFAGWRPREEIPCYIDIAGVCVICLRSTLNSNSIFTFKIFEYMSHKKPVIVPDVSTLGNLVRSSKSGLVSAVGSSDDLRLKILKVFRDKKEARQLGINGYNVTKRYSWQRVLRGIPRIFRD